jgi:hypothetical protein
MWYVGCCQGRPVNFKDARLYVITGKTSLFRKPVITLTWDRGHFPRPLVFLSGETIRGMWVVVMDARLILIIN